MKTENEESPEFEQGRCEGAQVRPHANGGQWQLANVLLPELVDVIFRYASQDKATISACALVSRDWRELALPHLFSDLKFRTRNARPLKHFQDFIDAHPHIARYVRKLELIAVLDAPMDPLRPLDLRTLAAVVTSLAGLRVLYLCEPFFDGTDSALSSLSSIMLPRRLEKLTVDICRDEEDTSTTSITTLIGVLRTFPADSIHLSYFDIACVPPSDPRMAQLIQSSSNSMHVVDLKLDRLDGSCYGLERLGLGHLFDALCHVLKPGYLRSLQCRPYKGSDYGDTTKQLFGKFLHHTAETLQDLALPFLLRLPVRYEEYKPDGWSVICLDECRNLESFTLWLDPPKIHSPPDSPGVHGYHGVPLSMVCIAIMAHLPHTLRVFTLGLCERFDPEHIRLSEVGLDVLDDALSGQRASSLEKVKVVIGSKRDFDQDDWVDMDACSRAVREMMPQCEERGILEVVEEPIVCE
ncbi:hypothetical protein C8Q70DRAFT_544557 [Cubamyces menziesii]|nr:hypothetical protein C8Q70DRAFT_544557 [Cubamyces menziesii]